MFRTMTGFHDAYVAAPSRSAALRAWGATTDLFAMDAAEEVTDPKRTAEPLKRPGEVIKQSRGSDEEHLAAANPATKSKAKSKGSPRPKATPRPSRVNLEKAERRLADVEAERNHENDAFEREKAALLKREAAARRAFETKRLKLDTARQTEAEAYDEALAKWRVS